MAFGGLLAVALAGCLPASTRTTATTTTTASSTSSGGSSGGSSTPTITTTTTLPKAPTGASAPPVTMSSNWAAGAPDPFVMTVQDQAFCGSTSPCYAAYSTQVGFVNVPVFRSTNLSSWEWKGDALQGVGSTNATWAQFGFNWAPGVFHRADGTYVMYYTARSKSLAVQCIGIATSTHPEGPFTDSRSGPFYCQSGGTIDASPYLDPTTNRLYLLYKSDSTNRISSRELNATTGTSFVGSEVRLLSSGAYSWENPVEAPSMMRNDAGVLFLYYSAGPYWQSSYSVGVARCSSPSGPCSRVYSTPVLATRVRMYGPGGQTPIRDLGGTWRMGFHAWDSSSVVGNGDARKLHFLAVTFPNGNPKIG